jgi:glycosidase
MLKSKERTCNMIKEALLHIPLSNYANAVDENHIVFRLRAARGDLKSAAIFFGDRYCCSNPIALTKAKMELAASDELFDYFETCVEIPYTRICYFFEITDGKETIFYYSDNFSKQQPDERGEYYQIPFNRREDIVKIPEWFKNSVVYNIFPDSFATSRRYISGEPCNAQYGHNKTKSLRGGKIKGITENIDYIKELGATCIYINPIFVAGEYHKYDLIDYFHIDPCFGTDDDFKELVGKCHQNGIKVIVDGVFNHCGWNFFAFEDVIKNGENSKYKDWFYRIDFPLIKSDAAGDYPNYDCFAYEKKMPKMNTSNPEVVEYFCKVCRHWIENFSIDGWRLDVANEINHDFWRAFRKTAKAANPDCILIGEIWEPAGEWLKGDQLDSVMNYPFRNACRDFFALENFDAFEFDARISNILMMYNKNTSYGLLNLLDSHDVSRFLSLCGGDKRRLKLAVLFQMTFVGVPSIFYGDEQGIEGYRESDYRRTMKWDESYDEMYSFYKDAIALRKNNTALRIGEYRSFSAPKYSKLYAFSRSYQNEKIYVILNAGEREEKITNPVPADAKILLSDGFSGSSLSPFGFCVFKA